jgi:hypothetical protein
MELSGDELRKFAIFHPLAMEKYIAMHKPNSRFVHYCTAEAAFHIIRSNRMRLRNAAVMNDFMEIEHGAMCLRTAWHSPTGERFKKVVEGLFPGLIEELGKRYDSWHPDFHANTFITCLSEHDAAEDNLGRLSMWRAYGGKAGVAVILNPSVFLGNSDAVPAFTSPVAYLSQDAFIAELGRVTDNIEGQSEFLRQAGREDMLNSLFHAFRLAAVCTKHPGFQEEREWRIVYAPSFNSSDRIVRSVDLIHGVPQIVHNIPFKDYPDEGFVGAELPKLIHRIIIGPTEFPEELRLATIALLEEAKVPDAAGKVVCSTIPLRQ